MTATIEQRPALVDVPEPLGEHPQLVAGELVDVAALVMVVGVQEAHHLATGDDRRRHVRPAVAEQERRMQVRVVLVNPVDEHRRAPAEHLPLERQLLDL
jgi:hypothetical protein